MTHATFYLSSYARCVKQRPLNCSRGLNSTESSQNSAENIWTTIDGSVTERDLSLVYNGESDELAIYYKDSTKESLQLPMESTFKVFLKQRIALFLITRNEQFQQFKVQFISEKSAADFFNLMNKIISIERLNTEKSMEINDDAQLTTIDPSMNFELEEQRSQKAITYASSQASQLTQPYPSSFINDDSTLAVNEDTLNKYVEECLHDPEFPAFVQRVRRVASTFMMNTFN